MDLSGALFGWPAVIASIVFLLIGLFRRHTYWLIFGTILSLPFTFYIALAPRFGFWVYMITISLFGSIVAMRKEVYWLAWVLIVPYIIVIAWLVVQVFLHS